MRASLLALAAPLALLAGCGGDDAGTSISIKGNDSEGKPATASMDGGSGQVKIDVPGFEASIKLPKIQLDADNFDLGGVKLYPGSKVTSMNIDAAKEDQAGDAVTIAFEFARRRGSGENLVPRKDEGGELHRGGSRHRPVGQDRRRQCLHAHPEPGRGRTQHRHDRHHRMILFQAGSVT